jgi:hypothetical protein
MHASGPTFDFLSGKPEPFPYEPIATAHTVTEASFDSGLTNSGMEESSNRIKRGRPMGSQLSPRCGSPASSYYQECRARTLASQKAVKNQSQQLAQCSTSFHHPPALQVASIYLPPTSQRPNRDPFASTRRHERYYVLYSRIAIFHEGYVPIQCSVSGSEVVFTRTTAGRTS